MPFKIGCGMAKGHWSNYLKMIIEFARQYNKHVIIVVPDQSKFPNTYKKKYKKIHTSDSMTHVHVFSFYHVSVHLQSTCQKY